jgi:hypothetical protein
MLSRKPWSSSTKSRQDSAASGTDKSSKKNSTKNASGNSNSKTKEGANSRTRASSTTSSNAPVKTIPKKKTFNQPVSSTGMGGLAGSRSMAASPRQSTNLSPKAVIDSFTQIIESKNSTEAELRTSLKKLRLLCLKQGIPDVQTRHGSLRSCVWKILLGVYRIDAVEYISLVQKGPCPVWEKIQNDVFRTLATDVDFTRNVTNEMISRLLHSFVWKTLVQPKSRLVNLSFSYVQGMNVLAAPFLYVMPELEAFSCFSYFILHSCPLYVQVYRFFVLNFGSLPWKEFIVVFDY